MNIEFNDEVSESIANGNGVQCESVNKTILHPTKLKKFHFKSLWELSLHKLGTFSSFSRNFSKSFTRDSDQKTRLPQVLFLFSTRTAYWLLQNKNNEFCHRLSFPVPLRGGRIFGQDYYWQWDLDCLCESWDKTAVNAIGTYHFFKQTKESPSNFVGEESHGYSFLGC